MSRIRVNDLHFSSLFSVNSDEVNKRFKDACEILNISKWKVKSVTTVEDAFSALRKSSSKTNLMGPEDSRILDVPGDGNCLFYSLLAPLLGRVPGQDVTNIVRKTIVEKVLEFKSLQKNFSFPGESVQIYGKKYQCQDVRDWAKYMQMNGAWGDNSVIQIFVDITGINVHVIPTDFLDLEGVITNYCPQEENHLDDAAITLIYGGNHYQLAVPTSLPKSVEVTIRDSPKVAPVVSMVDSEDDDWQRVSPLPRRKWERFTRKAQKGRKESLKNKVASPDVDKKEEEILVREERLDIGSYDSNSNDEDPLSSRIAAKKRTNSNFVDRKSEESSCNVSDPEQGGVKKRSTEVPSCYVSDPKHKQGGVKNGANEVPSCNVSAPRQSVKKGATKVPSCNVSDTKLGGVKNGANEVPSCNVSAPRQSVKKGATKVPSCNVSDTKLGGVKNGANEVPSCNVSAPRQGVIKKGATEVPSCDVSSDLGLAGLQKEELEDSGSNDSYNDLELGDMKKDEKECNSRNMKSNKTKKYASHCLSDWFGRIDENGNKVSSYLRSVEGNSSQVFCCLDNTTFSIKSRAFAAVTDHIKSRKHRLAVSGAEMHTGSYFLKNAPTSELRRKALMQLLIFSTCHGLAFVNIAHLVRTCQVAFPDSLIAKDLTMGRDSATYHLRHGLAKTTADKLFAQLRSSPFSLSFDAGTKGKQKRTEVIVRFWSEEMCRVVERSLFVISSNHETSALVSASLMSRFEELKVSLSDNLIMAHTDSSSVMRGKRAGALKLISNVAPQVLKCDIGGDGLHHVHNAEKKAFKNVFPFVIKFIDNVKYDIGCSPGKLEDYLKFCDVVGDRRTIPVSYCTSRFLDRFEAVRDRLEHIDALQEYYDNAKIPRCRNSKKKAEEAKIKDVELSDDSDSSDEDCINVDVAFPDDEVEEDLKGNPSGRVKFMKKALEEGNIIKTEFNLMLSYCCLKPGHDFLVIFQGKCVKVHLLFAAYERMLKDVLLEICDIGSLKDSKGIDLPGKELKFLKLESKEERRERKSVESSKNVEKSVRYGRLVEESACLLTKEIREGIKELCDKYKFSEIKEEEFISEAKSKCFKFHVQLAKSLQHYLPLDRDFLRWLKYLCPKQFLKAEESEAYIVKIAECLPSIKEEEFDDLRREVRMLKNFQNEYFGSNLEDYLQNAPDGFKKVKGEEEVVSIDEVWKPVIENEDTPVMRKLLMSSLSIFHGTASVEGSVNITRNLLGDRSRNLTDINLESKKMVKSAVREAPSNCCYDFDVDDQDYHSDWMEARSKWKKDGEKEDDQEFPQEPQFKNHNVPKPIAASENVSGFKGEGKDGKVKIPKKGGKDEKGPITKKGVKDEKGQITKKGVKDGKVMSIKKGIGKVLKEKKANDAESPVHHYREEKTTTAGNESGNRGRKRKNSSTESKGQSKMTSFMDFISQSKNKT